MFDNAGALREAVELLGGPERERIRACEGEGRALLFLDLSRFGARRWCSMSGCGNRAEARALRERGRGVVSAFACAREGSCGVNPSSRTRACPSMP